MLPKTKSAHQPKVPPGIVIHKMNLGNSLNRSQEHKTPDLEHSSPVDTGSVKRVKRAMRRSQSEMAAIESNVEEKLITNFCSLYFYQFCLGVGVL